MPTVECLLVRGEQLLLIRLPLNSSNPGMLLPIGGQVEPGESPLEGCLRKVREQAGLVVSPSCAAVTFNTWSDGRTDYHVTFVAPAPEQEPVTNEREGEPEWIELKGVPYRQDIPELDRALIPRILAASAPFAVHVNIDMTSDPYIRRLQSIEAIDPGRLSPLVFGTST